MRIMLGAAVAAILSGGTALAADLKLPSQLAWTAYGTGSAGYNQKLSKERARSVVDYLLRNGIEADRLVFEGYGMDQPIADNKTEEGRQQNRRTEFKVLEK